jgi:hypothetical protein
VLSPKSSEAEDQRFAGELAGGSFEVLDGLSSRAGELEGDALDDKS